MFYWKYSSTTTYFINEYWLFIPSACLINYFIIRKRRLNKRRIEQLKTLLTKIEREQKIRKILLVSLGLSITGYSNLLIKYLLTRGGSDIIDLIDSDYIREACAIEQGIGFLENKRLRKIVISLYRKKGRAKIIYITATALCQIADQYGITFLAFPVAIGDFGITNLYQTSRKLVGTTLIGAAGHFVIMGGPIAAAGCGLLGLRFVLNNLDVISTTQVDPTKELTIRKPGEYEVVVVNNRDKITMHNPDPVKENPECWLPDQRLLNQNCQLKSTQIPEAINLALPEDLDYDDIVTMKDVTSLRQHEFTDQFDLGKICEPRQEGKEVNFLDKFGDEGKICDQETWDTGDNEINLPEEKYIRTRNKP